MEKYQTLDDVKKALEEDNHDFHLFILNSIGIANELYAIPMKERLEAMEWVHQKFVNETKEELEDVMQIRKRKQEEGDPLGFVSIVRNKEQELLWKEQRLQEVKRLRVLFEENAVLPFEEGKEYEVTDWKFGYYGDSGYRADEDIEKRVKVTECSVFENAYRTFVLGITTEPHPKDTSGFSFVRVEPVDGECKEFPFFVREDKLKAL